MGRGNWIPDTPIYEGDYDLAYVELTDETVAEQEESEEIYENFYGNLEEILPKSFRKLKRGENKKYLSNDTVVLYTNQLLLVTADCQGDYWHQGVAVVAREDAPAFAQSQIHTLAKRLWKGLAKRGYKLCRRDTAWTCKPFIPS
jgi:hypothetical protein